MTDEQAAAMQTTLDAIQQNTLDAHAVQVQTLTVLTAMVQMGTAVCVLLIILILCTTIPRIGKT